MAGYGQFCPVAKAAEVACERWTPLILRELMSGSARFNEIHRGVPLMSPALLSRRLRSLEASGTVRRTGVRGRAAYHLTDAGWELKPLVDALAVWGQRWLRGRLDNDDLDPGLLMWDIRRRINPQTFPRARTCLRFDFAGTRRGLSRWWLLGDADGVELCIKDPGFDVDLYVSTDVRTLTGVWSGDLPVAAALRNGGIELDGPSTLRKAFPTWLQLGVYAAVRPASRRSTTRDSAR